MSDDDGDGAESAAPEEPDGSAVLTSEKAETSGTDTESVQSTEPESAEPALPAEPESAEPAESEAGAENAADDDAPQHVAETSEPAAEPDAGSPETSEPAAESDAEGAEQPIAESSMAEDPSADAERSIAEDPVAERSTTEELPAEHTDSELAASGPPTAVMEPVREPETQVIERVEPETERLPANPLAASTLSADPSTPSTTGPGTPPPSPPAGEPAQAAEPDRSNRTLLLFGAIIVAVLIIGALGAVIGSAARHGSDSGAPGTTPAISIPASGVSVVELDGVAGKVSINTAATSSVEISSGSPAQLGHQFDAATHTLDLSCATSGGNCPAAAYTVTIPQHVGLTLHQISGQTTLSGVSGPVSITASSASTTATGLTATSFTAVITGGELDAAFTGVPQRVSVSVISAQATLHLPGSAQYAVDEQIISGNANVQIPRVASAPNVVEANVTSGQITLLAD